MPTPTTADLATLVYTAAGDLVSDYADLVQMVSKYDPNYILKSKIEGPVRIALLRANEKLISARLRVQEATSMAATQLKIPREELHGWSDTSGDQS